MIHWCTNPKSVIFFWCSEVRIKWLHRRYPLQIPKLIWKFIFNKNSAFGCSEIGSWQLNGLVVKWFVDDSYSWAAVDCHSDHACNMIKMSFNKSLSTIKRINPNDHIFFVKFIREIVEIPSSFTCFLGMDAFDFAQVFSVGALMNLIILHQHFLRNCIFINLIRPNVRITCIKFTDFIFFSDYSCLRKNSFKIIFDSVLDMHIC